MERSDVEARLSYLNVLDRNRDYFGAKAHQYRLHRVAAEADVTSLETRRHFALPGEYRRFITTVGNGGAGPYYGLYPLGFEHSPRILAEWDDQLLGDLSKPFPHREAWNLPEEFWADQPDPPPDMPPDEEDRLMETWDARLGQQYWRRDLVDGAIPLADMGCALGIILVVTGPEAGTVWEDLRADHTGIRPVADSSGSRLTFMAWYLNWVNTGISKFGGNPAAIPTPPRPWWRRLLGGEASSLGGPSE